MFRRFVTILESFLPLCLLATDDTPECLPVTRPFTEIVFGTRMNERSGVGPDWCSSCLPVAPWAGTRSVLYVLKLMVLILENDYILKLFATKKGKRERKKSETQVHILLDYQ